MTHQARPLVTTIIPVYNRQELLAASVASVIAQTHRPIEILIVDDGSSQEYAQFYASLAKQHSEITVITQPNQGPGAARETGRLKAKGEFIQYLDSDDLIAPQKFTEQLQALSSDASIHICYGQCVEYRTTGDEQDLNDAMLWKHLPPMRLTGTKQKALFPAILRERWWITSAPLYRTSFLQKVGPWLNLINEEDWEYDARVASLGGEIAYTPKIVSVRLLHQEHLSAEGSIDPAKLADRCRARCAIYDSAKRYQANSNSCLITKSDWQFFSKSTFLLARQCAKANLQSEFESLLHVSIEAVGSKTVAHRVFLLAVRFLGIRGAATLFVWLGK